MLKIESNLKINGRHWGLAFVDGVAYTANVALAAKLLLKGYVVTDQHPEAEHIVAGAMNVKPESSPNAAFLEKVDTDHSVSQLDQPVAVPIDTKQGLSPTHPSPAQASTIQTAAQPEDPVSILGSSVSIPSVLVSKATANPTKPRTTKPRKRAVTVDAADEHGV